MGLNEIIKKHGDKGISKKGWFEVKEAEENSRSAEIAAEILTPFGEGKTCEGCIFACGDTDMDNSPDKASCLIYAYPKAKPDSVYLEGKPCKHRRTGKEAVEIAKGGRADK